MENLPCELYDIIFNYLDYKSCKNIFFIKLFHENIPIINYQKIILQNKMRDWCLSRNLVDLVKTNYDHYEQIDLDQKTKVLTSNKMYKEISYFEYICLKQNKNDYTQLFKFLLECNFKFNSNHVDKLIQYKMYEITKLLHENNIMHSKYAYQYDIDYFFFKYLYNLDVEKGIVFGEYTINDQIYKHDDLELFRKHINLCDINQYDLIYYESHTIIIYLLEINYKFDRKIIYEIKNKQLLNLFLSYGYKFNKIITKFDFIEHGILERSQLNEHFLRHYKFNKIDYISFKSNNQTKKILLDCDKAYILINDKFAGICKKNKITNKYEIFRNHDIKPKCLKHILITLNIFFNECQYY